MIKSALLVLEDGTQFHGRSIGAVGAAVGEVVFNTSMTGYQEILTDPSYSRQIVTFTYPHIGNTGTNSADEESATIQVQGMIVRDLPLIASSYRNEEDLSQYLQRHHVVAIADIDTRKLTRLLRDKGTKNGCIIVGDPSDALLTLALEKIKQFPGLKGMDLAQEVSTKASYVWLQGSSVQKRKLPEAQKLTGLPFHVVAYDYGVKHNILRMLVDRGCRLTVVPARTPAENVLQLNPDGIFLSNGPGDPEPCDYAITAIKRLLETDIPLFGICLGHQLLALASGAKTIKMKFGHHGANHPVQDLRSNSVMITAQNHGFTVDEASLPANLRATHRSLFDASLQGITRTDKAAFSFQGHPEASPGPHDAAPLFDHFIELMKTYQTQSQHHDSH
ncbi:glutamine-hydrolyzing carbamoyl-phosphate synthase small subunit [Candidatus Fukatsuia symbiotica]|uniref:Carbamoyl phosphate synthase small chain n=1 Tax=Candidatus Fukatsuia symbiotica TaxID=1878942 RepID=A0A2U8I5Y5_9GAMM|nr:glutamine-hydrolyzing carbamoyl-phosphate synthase small subunit [Candidatus Fukatsuia symbiotica]AWK14497.1 carbamoyl phosphate synthase small subunit [Candidatus Fukatsuia symbiotica]MEA9444788.1 glutamine-hydrolyzing carbamoyl-phosphate synthase small subunit [Candidatus Fukatsuia symbiotica]